jgi:hypothetical protein
MDDILLITGKAVVNTDDFMSVIQELFAKMGPKEASAAGY